MSVIPKRRRSKRPAVGAPAGGLVAFEQTVDPRAQPTDTAGRRFRLGGCFAKGFRNLGIIIGLDGLVHGLDRRIGRRRRGVGDGVCL